MSGLLDGTVNVVLIIEDRSMLILFLVIVAIIIVYLVGNKIVKEA